MYSQVGKKENGDSYINCATIVIVKRRTQATTDGCREEENCEKNEYLFLTNALTASFMQSMAEIEKSREGAKNTERQKAKKKL